MNNAYPQNFNMQNRGMMPQNPDQGMSIDFAFMIQGGMNAVNGAYVPNGKTAALFDRDDAYFYLKQVNQNGQVVMLKRFRYEEDEPASEYIPREEFNKKFDELKELIASAIGASQTPQAAQNAASNGGDN
jgi:hypothetical protein